MKLKRFTVDLAPDVHDKFRRKAFDYDLPMTEAGRRLIRLWIEDKIDISRESPIRRPRKTAP
jgi:hypothetical protein